MATFPASPLPVQIHILLNGTWTDISEYVYQRDNIMIKGGRDNVNDQFQPATCNLTVNNRDGRFTQNNVSSPYYPYLMRNTQLRIYINNAQSSTLNTYSGYRFWGEVHRWPLTQDVSGKDVYCQIQAKGPWRRLRMHGGKGSALTRYYQTLTGSFTPVAYWPCEEDLQTSSVQSGISGGASMTITGGSPLWRGETGFNGSAPLPVINKSTWTGQTGSFGSSGNDLYQTPGTYQWIASTTSATVSAIGPGGGGGNGPGDGGGGGGQALGVFATTIGKAYNFTIPAGGQGGPGSQTAANNGSPGAAATTITLDNGTLTANPGQGGPAYPNGGTPSGGTASFTGGTSGQASHTGGQGGAFVPNLPLTGSQAGAGGGSSAGTAANGNAGGGSTNNSAGAGGVAPTGGFAGGAGATGPQGSPGTGGVGAGGGGGCLNGSTGYSRAGAAGGPGSMQFVYSSGSTPTNNVLRWVMKIPPHGGNVGKVLIRFTTGGTIATLDVQYSGAGGKLTLIGKNSGGTQIFSSGAQAWNLDGQTVMCSIELAPSGTNVNWAFKAITPGSHTLVGTASGTATTATIGNVTSCIVSPNGDITKTSLGHISVQYALIDLRIVSDHMNGHISEMGVDRFIRVCREQALDNIMDWNEGVDHWGFESGTQSWTGTNATLTSDTTSLNPGFVVGSTGNNNTGELGEGLVGWWNWPAEGTHSLKIVASGAGAITVSSPTGTSGIALLAGDTISIHAEMYTPAAVTGLNWVVTYYTAAGATISSRTVSLSNPVAGEIRTVKVTESSGAPTNTQYASIALTSSGTLTNGTTIFLDNVRVHPRMGRQERHEVHLLMEELRDLDQGMLKEAKELFGFKYRTRIRLINQSPALTLNYTNFEIAGQGAPSAPGGQGSYGTATGTPGNPSTLQPVFDDWQVKNDVTVKRHHGSKVSVYLNSGQMSTSEPPKGVGRHKHKRKTIMEIDQQLLAYAAHLLNLSTSTDYRYPTIDVDLSRAAIANKFAAAAGVEIGDYIQLTNLPATFPSSTAKQLVIGYTETIGAYWWYISFNCTPEAPYEITIQNLRRW